MRNRRNERVWRLLFGKAHVTLVVALSLVLTLYSGFVSAQRRTISTGAVNDFAGTVSRPALDRLDAMLRGLTSASGGLEFTIITIRIERDFLHPLGFTTAELQAQAEKVWQEVNDEARLARHVVLIVIRSSDQYHTTLRETPSAETELSLVMTLAVTDTPAFHFRRGDYDQGLVQVAKLVISSVAAKRGFSAEAIDGFKDPPPPPSMAERIASMIVPEAAALPVSVFLFAIGAALWMLGRNDSQIVVAQAVQRIALWLVVLAAAIGIFGYLFEMRDILSILLILLIIVFVVGFLGAFVAFFQDRPHSWTEDKYALKLSDGTTVPLALYVTWRLPRSLTHYDLPKVSRDVRAGIAEWFVSCKLDPPQTEEDARALIKNVYSKLSVFLIPAVLPYGSYLSVTVTDLTLPSTQKYPGIIIGVTE